METVRIGVLYDYPSADGGAMFEAALRLGLDAAKADGVVLVARTVSSPKDTDALAEAYRGLVSDGAIAVAGPAISDSAVAVVPLSAELRVPCINFSGSEHSRGDFAFHYQVGSLEEEPYVIARHLRTRDNRVAVVHDRSFIGMQYQAFFEDACRRVGLEIVRTAGIEPDGTDAAVAAGAVADVPALAYLGLGPSAYPLALALPRSLPVVATSALIFGYAMPEWTAAWDGWAYIDAVHDDNPKLAAVQRAWTADFPPGPIVPCAHDIGQLIGEALRRAPQPDGEGIRSGLEQVKQLPAALGAPGTVMGFGRHDRGALKGEFLVIREWRAGQSVLRRAPDKSSR